MSLDAFPSTQRQALEDAARNIAQDLPATFSEGFDEALRTGMEWRSNIAYANAREAAVEQYVQTIRDMTGVAIQSRPVAPYGHDPTGTPTERFNKEIAELGERFPDLALKPVTDEDLDRMTLQRMAATHRAHVVMEQRERTWGGTFGGIAGSLAAFGQDPVNIVLAPLGGYGSGIGLRALEFGALAGGAEVISEIAQGPTRERAVPGAESPAANIALAAATGAVLGGAFGVLARLLGEGARTLPTSTRDALHAATSDAQVSATNILPDVAGEMAHHDALLKAVGQIARGERVSAAEGLDPAVAAAFHARLAPVLDARARLADEARLPPTMERLSEAQLADLRSVIKGVEIEAEAARTRLGAREERLAAERASAPEIAARAATLREELASLRSDIAAREGNIPARGIDEATAGRLQAIEADLARPGLGADAKALLEAERASITETLATRTPQQLSIEQELRGLGRAATRTERRLRTTEDSLAKSLARIERLGRDLERQSAAIDRVSASKAATAIIELRKSIARLAQGGYGLKLPIEEAEDLAARIIAAPDEELPAVLRSVTEEFQTRPRGEGETLPRHGAQAARWHAEMTSRVQDLARSAGREMTKDELGTFVEHLNRVSEGEAIGALGELTQRPLTILERPDVLRRELPPRVTADSALGRSVTGDPALAAAANRKFSPAEIAKLGGDSQVDEAILRDMDRIRLERPELDLHVAEPQPDGTVRLTSRRLEDVLDEIDGLEKAGKEFEACVTGIAA